MSGMFYTPKCEKCGRSLVIGAEPPMLCYGCSHVPFHEYNKKFFHDPMAPMFSAFSENPSLTRKAPIGLGRTQDLIKINCQNCGAPNSSGTLTCSYCGTVRSA